MSKTVKFIKRLFTHTFTPTAALPGGRFADASGNLLTAPGTRATGVSFVDDSVDADDVTAKRQIGVTILGIEGLEVGAATAAGPLTNDSQGRGVDAAAGDPVNAWGLEAGAAAGAKVPALVFSYRERVASAANPDTSGLAVAALETEVNELKAALREHGIIAP